MKKNLNKILKAGLISVITIGSGFAFGALVAFGGWKWLLITAIVAVLITGGMLKYDE